MNQLIERLILNRAALIIKNFDQQLKEILDVDLKTYNAQNTGNHAGNQSMMAS